MIYRGISSRIHALLHMKGWLLTLLIHRNGTACMSNAIYTLRPRQNGSHITDDMFKCIFLNENVWIPIEMSLKFVPKGSINNNQALFQIMALWRPGDKPLSEPMMVSSLTHIFITWPQWVKGARCVLIHFSSYKNTATMWLPYQQKFTPVYSRVKNTSIHQ